MFSFFKKQEMDVKDLDEHIGEIHLIDVREKEEFTGGHIKTAKNIPMAQLLAQPEQYLDHDTTYYLICHSGMRSGKTVSALQQQGFKVINVKGGFSNYRGLHIER